MNAEQVIQLQYSLRRGSFVLDVEANIPMQGITGVFGASGAGKTSLLRCIAGLESPEKGRLVVGGDVWQDSNAATWRDAHERRVGYVFQEPNLFSHLDVRGNIDYGLRRRGGNSAVDKDHITELLGLVSLLDRRPADLSGGEAQRVAIARALLSSPRFVLMDEPLASLDQRRRNEILPYLDRLHAEAAVPIVYVSHNIDEICHLCDHLLVIDAGRIVASGELQSVLVDIDVPVLTGDEAGSVIGGVVAGYDEADDLSTLRYSGGELLVPGKVAARDSHLRLRIRASDVSLCLEPPKSSTILNIVPVTIEALHEDDGPSVLVRLMTGNDRIVARVTRRSCRQLGLEEGGRVYAQIKSVAVRRA
jgi:molybdate transport system ATP-binding protein